MFICLLPSLGIFKAIILQRFFSALHSSAIPSECLMTWMLDLLLLSQWSLRLWSVFSIFILSVVLIGSFLMIDPVFKFIVFFLCHSHLLLSPSKEYFILVPVFFSSQISIWFFPFLFGSSLCLLFLCWDFYFKLCCKNVFNCFFQHTLTFLFL